MVASPSELDGLYRFVEHEDVNWQSLLSAHVQQSCTRIRDAGESTVLVIHDSTSFAFSGDAAREGMGWLGPKQQGFFAHIALAVSADGSRCPLGVLGMSIIMRPRHSGPRAHRSGSEWAGNPNRESLRWKRLVDETSSAVCGHAIPIHVMDREADAYELLSGMIADSRRFVVRAKALDRPVTTAFDDFHEAQKLHLVAERAVPIAKREVRISRRKPEELADARKKHPPRPARTAKLEIASARVRMRRSRYHADPILPTIDVHVVHVRELDAPNDMEPVEWFLLTTEPIDSIADVLRVVDIYRARWTIEELFKAIKTGCEYESRQLESAHALLNALALCIPVAWQMLALRQLARTAADQPAETVLAPARLAVLREIAHKSLSDLPTAREVLLAIAMLGGHLPKNGDPGWLTLRRGFDRLLLAEQGWHAHARAGLPQGHTRSGG